MKTISMKEIIETNTYKYGSFVIENRSLADYRDGLKNVQRRILWAMYELNLTPTSNYKKSIRIVGDTTGKYHPHNADSIYSTLVKLVNAPVPLVDGMGNYGSPFDSPASMRYPEARLNSLAYKYLFDKDYLDVVSYDINFSGDLKEPIFLPAKIPLILLNGVEGIAVGISVLISPFDPEVILSIISKYLQTKKIKYKKLKVNFPYGGIVKDKVLINTDKSFVVYPSYKKDKNNYIINGFCNRFDMDKVLKKLAEKGDVNVTGNLIIFECRDKNIDSEKFVNKVLSSTIKPQYYVVKRIDNENSKFKKSSFKDIVVMWSKFRINLEKKVIKYRVNKRKEKRDYLNSLYTIINNKDVLFKIFSSKNSINEIISSISKSLSLDKEVVSNILNKEKLISLSKKSSKDIKDKINILNKEIKELKNCSPISSIIKDFENFIKDYKNEKSSRKGK